MKTRLQMLLLIPILASCDTTPPTPSPAPNPPPISTTPFTVKEIGVGDFGVVVLPEPPKRVSTVPSIPVEFNDAYSSASVNNVKLVNDSTGAIIGLTNLSAGSNKIFFYPSSILAYNTTYTLIIPTTVKSSDGRSLIQEYTRKFITQLRPYQLKGLIKAVSVQSTPIIDVEFTNNGLDAVTETLSIEATCTESGYPNVYTTLTGSVSGIPIGGKITTTLTYSKGFNYFTSTAIQCIYSAVVPDQSRTVIFTY